MTTAKPVLRIVLAAMCSFPIAQAQYVQLSPSATQTVTQPSGTALIVNNLDPVLVNGEVQAAAFAGGDPCVKLNAALIYSVTNGLPSVNATGFSGTVSCSVNPWNLTAINPSTGQPYLAAGAATHLSVRFGTVHFQFSSSTAQWAITNSGISIQSPGPFSLQLEYTGTTVLASALWVNANSTFLSGNGLNGMNIDGIFVYGDNNASGGAANLTDAVLFEGVARSRLANISAWGASNAGIEYQGLTTVSMYNQHASHTEFLFLLGSSSSAGHTAPSTGLLFSKDLTTGYLDTASTIVDAIAEGVTGAGWHLTYANNLTFVGGTSEGNGRGILLDTVTGANKNNLFLSNDLENNGTGSSTGPDVYDNSGYNGFYNLITHSTCSTGCASNTYLSGIAGNDTIFGVSAGLTGSVSGPGTFGLLPFNPNPGSTIPSTSSGYVQMWVYGQSVYVPYFSTLP